MKQKQSRRASNPGSSPAAETASIEETVRKDAETVSRLGLTNQAIADVMSSLRMAGASGLGAPVKVAPHFVVEVDSIRGRLPCPFAHQGLYPKTNVTVTNTSTGRQISFSDLHIHMIEAHGFYDLPSSPYRLEPASLADILEIKAE